MPLVIEDDALIGDCRTAALVGRDGQGTMTRARPKAMKILVVDVGGSHIKCLLTGQEEPRKFDSGPEITPGDMVKGVLAITEGWKFDAVSVGYPGVVCDGIVVSEPPNLAAGWVGFDFETAFSCPVKVINDAAMQALGAYEGGTMLFLGLGTGLGLALIVNGVIQAMELGHLRYGHGRVHEDYLGKRGLKRLGKKKWRRKVKKVAEGFRQALLPDDIVLGGGNVKKLKHRPAQTRRGNNSDAFKGGFRLWQRENPIPEQEAA